MTNLPSQSPQTEERVALVAEWQRVMSWISKQIKSHFDLTLETMSHRHREQSLTSCKPNFLDMTSRLLCCTDLIVHQTESPSSLVVVVSSQPYRLSEHKRKVVQEELGKMRVIDE